MFREIGTTILYFLFPKKKSHLRKKEINLKKKLNEAELKTDWRSKHALNLQLTWINTLKKDIHKNHSDPYKELKDTDLALPQEYSLTNKTHFDFCIEVVADTADFFGHEQEYKMCYYKPEAALPYSKESFINCANFLKNYFHQELQALKTKSKIERVSKQKKIIEELETLDFTTGLLFSIIPIDPEDLPTIPEENYKAGQQFEELQELEK